MIYITNPIGKSLKKDLESKKSIYFKIFAFMVTIGGYLVIFFIWLWALYISFIFLGSFSITSESNNFSVIHNWIVEKIISIPYMLPSIIFLLLSHAYLFYNTIKSKNKVSRHEIMYARFFYQIIYMPLFFFVILFINSFPILKNLPPLIILLFFIATKAYVEYEIYKNERNAFNKLL